MAEPGPAGHERWDELAAGHALHALEPAEAAEFDRHRPGCTRCQATYDEMSFVAAGLGALAASDAAGAPSWRRMRAGIVGPVPAPSPRRERSGRWLAPAAAVATALAAAAVIGVVVTGGGSPSLTAASCARDAGCHQVVLRTPGGRDAATVLVRGRTATISSVAIGAPPAGREWVLWQVPRGGGPVFVRSFGAAPTPAPSLSTTYAGTASFALSQEPAGTRPAQPTQVVATGPAG